MARLTTEDCLLKVKNRYDLIPLVAKRARQLILGKESLVDEDNDKPIVIALREIAQGLVTPENVDSVSSNKLLEEFLREEESENDEAVNIEG